MRDRTGIPVEGPHQDDQFWLDQITDNASRYGIKGGRNVTPDRYLVDGDKLELEGVTFDRITVDAARMGGLSCIRDLRVTVSAVRFA